MIYGKIAKLGLKPTWEQVGGERRMRVAIISVLFFVDTPH